MDADAQTIGNLCLESILAYRTLSREEANAYLDAMQASFPTDKEMEARAERYPRVVVWPNDKNFEINCALDGKVKSRSKLPLDASAEAIGTAVLAAFRASDKKSGSRRS